MSEANGTPKEPAALEPVDNEAFMMEFQAGLEFVAEVPLSQSKLAALAYASQYALMRKDCPLPMKELLKEFVEQCQAHAGFGEQTQRLLAWQAHHLSGPVKPLIIVPGGR